jgi:hypothetical protein
MPRRELRVVGDQSRNPESHHFPCVLRILLLCRGRTGTVKYPGGVKGGIGILSQRPRAPF